MREQREEDVLDAHIFVLHAVGFALRLGQRAVDVAGDVDLARLAPRPRDAGHPVDAVFQLAAERVRVDAHFLHQLGNEPVLLLQKGFEQVLLLNLHTAAAQGEVLRLLDGLQGFLGKLLSVHRTTPFS